MSDPGRSFGVAAAAYDRGRPEWPERLLDELPLDAAATVVDLGAGTGKLTRLLARRYAHVIAVEPDDAMRALVPGDARPGTAEAIPVDAASVDAVFAAEAFHWFEPLAATAEIARVLRPGGVVALLWNVYVPEDALLPDDAIPSPGSSQRRVEAEAEWRALLAAGPFEPLRSTSLAQEREVPRDELLDYFASISPTTALPPDERRRVLARVDALLDRPSYRRRWTTELHWTRRR